MEDRFASFDSSSNRSALVLGLAHFRSFAIFLIVVILGGLVALYFIRENIGEAIRVKIESQINSKLASQGFSVSIAECELIEGKGFRIRNLTFSLADDRTPFAVIDECFVQIPAYLPQLILGHQTVEALEIHRASVHLHRDKAGNWNLDDLAKLFGNQQEDPELPPILIRDSKIVFTIDSQAGTRKSEIRGINLDVQQASLEKNQNSPVADDSRSATIININGFLSSDFVDRVSIVSRIDTIARRWAVGINAKHARVNERLLEFIPVQLLDQLGPAKSFRGSFDLRGTATGSFDITEVPQFECSGSLFDSSLDDPSLPFPISRCSCDFKLDNRRFEVTNVKGKVGNGQFSLNGTRDGLASEAPWAVNGQLYDIVVDSRLYPFLPPNMQKFWRQYSPEGTIDLKFEMDFDGKTVDSEFVTTAKQCSFSFFKFPYRIGECRGKIYWTPQKSTVELYAEENGQPIKITSSIDNPGPGWTGWMKLQVDGYLPIDSKLFAACRETPGLLEVISPFSPTGQFKANAMFERTSPTQVQPTQDINIQLKDCSIRHKSFDYPFFGVSGQIIAKNQHVDVRQIQGSRDNGYVVCNGQWNKKTGLNLEFRCNTIELDDQLRHALPVAQRAIWDRLQPSGTIDDLTVQLRHQKGWPQPKVAIHAEVFEQRLEARSNVSIQPTWFPYRVSQVTGKMDMADGKLKLEKLNGVHGDTWITMNGQGNYDEHSWSLKLDDMLVSSLSVDEDLYRALPFELENGIRKLQFEGQVELEGSIVLQGGRSNDSAETAYNRALEPSDESQIDWDLTLTTHAANLFVGVPIENVTGRIRLLGRQANGVTKSVGEIEVDSLIYEDLQVTNLRGPISIDDKQIGIGTWADLSSINQVPAPFSGTLFDGRIAIDAVVACSKKGEFQVRATLQEFELGQLAADISPGSENVVGKGYAGLNLRGDQTGRNSVQGDGYVRLRNARIYELPVILSLLTVSKISQFDRSAFDESNVDFTVRGTDIELNRIELIGDAISLIGNGTMNTNHAIDLNFYTVVGRNRLYIPLLTQLYRASSKQILWVRVDGTLQNPNTTQEILPGLNDTLKQVFEDFESSRRTTNRTRSNGSLSPLPGQ